MRVQLSRTFTFEATYRRRPSRNHKCRPAWAQLQSGDNLAGEVDEAKHLVDYAKQAVCQPVFDRWTTNTSTRSRLENRRPSCSPADLAAGAPNLPHLPRSSSETCNTSCEYRGE